MPFPQLHHTRKSTWQLPVKHNHSNIKSSTLRILRGSSSRALRKPATLEKLKEESIQQKTVNRVRRLTRGIHLTGSERKRRKGGLKRRESSTSHTEAQVLGRSQPSLGATVPDQVKSGLDAPPSYKLHRNQRVWIDDVLITLKERNITVASLRDDTVHWVARCARLFGCIDRSQDTSGYNSSKTTQQCVVRLELVDIASLGFSQLSSTPPQDRRSKVIASFLCRGDPPRKACEPPKALPSSVAPITTSDRSGTQAVCWKPLNELDLVNQIDIHELHKVMQMTQELLQRCIAVLGSALIDQPEIWPRHDEVFEPQSILDSKIQANSLSLKLEQLGLADKYDIVSAFDYRRQIECRKPTRHEREPTPNIPSRL